jgi:hypothetical protein
LCSLGPLAANSKVSNCSNTLFSFFPCFFRPKFQLPCNMNKCHYRDAVCLNSELISCHVCQVTSTNPCVHLFSISSALASLILYVSDSRLGLTCTAQSPVFLSLLCAHALCSCFELCALCSVLMLCAYRGFWSPLAKHEACARSMRTEQMASSSRRALLLTKIGSFCRAWPSMKH